MSELVKIITAADPAVRDRSLGEFCESASLADLLNECKALDAFRRSSDNLYERVRALFFLYGIHRFHIPLKSGVKTRALVPFNGYNHLLRRRFEEAIEVFLEPKLPTSHLAVVGHTPIAEALADLGRPLGLSVEQQECCHGFDGATAVIIASHGRGEPEAIRGALDAGVGLIGLVASRRRGRAVLDEMELTDDERSAFTALNDAYTTKFGFPFIIAVRDNTKASIMVAFERRNQQDRETEFAEACRQVERIAELRLVEKFST